MEKHNNNKESVPHNHELLDSFKYYREILNHITELKENGKFDSTVKKIESEIKYLEERVTELENQIFSYDSDDKIGLQVDLDRTQYDLMQKKKNLDTLTQDLDVLKTTVEDLNDLIDERAPLN